MISLCSTTVTGCLTGEMRVWCAAYATDGSVSEATV